MIVDLGALEVLEAILAQGSFSKAAASLHKTQAAVSYKIRKLEEQLGVVIFDRNGYRAELTPAGVMVLEEGRQLLHHAKRIRSIARNLNQDWEPYLQLVVDGALPMAPVMRALQALAERNAPTRVRVKIEFLHGVQECFEDDDADLMIAREVDEVPHYRVAMLPQIDFVLCVAPEHALAGRPRVSRSDLREYVKILVRDSRAQIGTSDDVIAADGQRALYLSDFDSKKRAIAMGLGYGWLPTHLIDEELRDGRLLPVEFVNGNAYAFAPRLVTRLNRHRGRAVELLERELLARFGAVAVGAAPADRPQLTPAPAVP